MSESSGGVSARSVLILVENLPVPFDRRVWQEATALRDAGYAVTVVCPTSDRHPEHEEELDGISILRHDLPVEAEGALGYLREYTAALFQQSRLAFKAWRRRRFDVIQACNPPDLLFLVALPYRILFGVRFIFDHHDLSPELYEAKFARRGLFHRLLTLAERATFRLADVSIATNETFERIAVARGGMAADRVFVVRSYPRLDRFRRVAPQDGLTAEGETLIGYLGVIGSQDGIDLLIEAMAELVHGGGRSDLRCLVIGDGPALESCKALAVTLGVADRVAFPGFLSGEALLAHLSAIDVGVIPDPPNAFNDKLSMNKVFEYMALGIPFAMFGLEQAAREAGDGAVKAPDGTARSLAAAIATLADDPALRARMGRESAARASVEFTWDREVPSLLRAYETALATRGAEPVRRSTA